jgi:hypothetical protein
MNGFGERSQKRLNCGTKVAWMPSSGDGWPIAALLRREQTGDGMLCSPAVSSNSLSQTGVNAETFCCFAESLISCPQKRGRIDEDRGYQLGVGQTDA